MTPHPISLGRKKEGEGKEEGEKGERKREREKEKGEEGRGKGKREEREKRERRREKGREKREGRKKEGEEGKGGRKEKRREPDIVIVHIYTTFVWLCGTPLRRGEGREEILVKLLSIASFILYVVTSVRKVPACSLSAGGGVPSTRFSVRGRRLARCWRFCAQW